MGLTKAEKAQRHQYELKKWREYNKVMEPKREETRARWLERIRTMEMLLNAKFDHTNKIFIKHRGEENFIYYDHTGAELTTAKEVEEQRWKRLY